MSVKRLLSRLLMDERGASAIEYGMICAMIVLGLIAAVNGVATETTKTWNTVSSKSAEAMGGP